MNESNRPQPTIIDILNDSLKRGNNDPDNFPTVELMAERMGIDNTTLHWWLENDKEFQDGLTRVKKVHNSDLWRETFTDETKLDTATLSFSISVVLEETKKRYTV